MLLPGKSHGWRSLAGCSPWSREESDMTERLHFHFHFHALEKELATHSSVIAWRIPGTAEPGGLQSVGPHRVRHDWCDLAAAAAVACGNFIFKSQRHSIVNLSEVKHSFPCLLPHPPLPGYHAEPPVKSITCMSSLSSTFIIPHCNHVENKIQV